MNQFFNSCRKIPFSKTKSEENSTWGRYWMKGRNKKKVSGFWVFLVPAGIQPTFIHHFLIIKLIKKAPKKTQSKSMFKPQRSLAWQHFQTSCSKLAVHEHTSHSGGMIYLSWEQRSCPALAGTRPASLAQHKDSNSCQFRKKVKFKLADWHILYFRDF